MKQLNFIGKFDHHRICWGQERQSKARNNLPKEPVSVDDRIGINTDNRKTKFTQSYLGQEIVESRDLQRPLYGT